MRFEASTGLLCFAIGGGLLLAALELVLNAGSTLIGPNGVFGIIIGLFSFLLSGLGLYLIMDDALSKKHP